MSDSDNKFRVVYKNAFFHSKAPIVYNMARTNVGWRLTAYVPATAPAKDRLTVVQWLGNYEQQVKKEQPGWVVRFKSPDLCHYQIDMLPLHTAGAGEKNQAQLVQNVDTLWHQMSLDYA